MPRLLSEGKKRIEKCSQDNAWRIRLLAVCFAIGVLMIIGRLFNLQILSYEEYAELAENQHTILRSIDAQRGEIFLRDGNNRYPLAVNKNYPTVFLSPKEVTQHDEVVQLLSQELSLNPEDVRSKLADPDDPFEIVAKRVPEEHTKKIKEARFRGVYVSDERYRFYPSGNLASHAIGFVGSDGEKLSGRYGIEAYFEEELRGKKGEVFQKKDAGGRWIPTKDRRMDPAQKGASVVLTLDQTVQFEAQRILKKYVKENDADGGTLIVMNPQDGKILALANEPDFDPNAYGQVEDISYFLNPALSLPYESGSVFKPLTLAMGIDVGKITPETTFVDTGAVKIAEYTIKNSESKIYGKQTMLQVLEESINTGTIFVEKLIGNETFLEYVKNFGFGSKTGISLPGEVAGSIRQLDNIRQDINYYTASFGQGISVTPIQLVAAYGALANGGELLKPQIVDSIEYTDGHKEVFEREVIRRVLQEETTQTMGKMLVSVVEDGHGKRASVPGYAIGGKTGTAQVATHGGYDENYFIGSFIGYGPMEDPKFVILVKVDNPKKVIFAESSAAPAFGEMMKFLLDYYSVRPTTSTEIGV